MIRTIHHTNASSTIWILSVVILLQLLLEQKNNFHISGLAIPKSELVNRRKSPALWREDLQPNDNIEDTFDKTKQRKLQVPPEVMSPVGGWPQLHAAIGNGADSIYLGLSAFSARARATNFDPITELPKAVDICHKSGVKVYVALNTLVFDHELKEVEGLILACASAKVDALIVQDLGVARLARRVAPSIEIHASTQQTITSADGAAFIANLLDSTRIVLGRELSINEISQVASKLDEGIEIEAFVHGALCVSYSGQCFSSEAWGGRSANRGQCAQACRLPYGLIDNGILKELGDFSYLLSPQDLCGIDHVPDMIRAGVSCLKIEGRLKDAAYVAATTRAYRNAVDKGWEQYCNENSIDFTIYKRQLIPEDVSKKELAQMFSRGQDENHDGLSAGFFNGSQHQKLVRGRSPRHRGIHIGRVVEGSSWKTGLVIVGDQAELGQLKLGDGLVVDRGLAQEDELGGAIYDIHDQGSGRVVVHFSRDVERNWKKYDDSARKGFGSATILAPENAHVWKTSDATVEKKMKRLVESPPPKVLVSISVEGSVGNPLIVRITDPTSRKMGVGMTESILEPAQKAGLSAASVKKAVGTLGNTNWAILDEIDISNLEQDVWCPMSWVKDARRQAVEDLEFQSSNSSNNNNSNENFSAQRDPNDIFETNTDLSSEILSALKAERIDDTKNDVDVRLSVLARNYEQVDVLCRMVECGKQIYEIIVDFLEVDGMRDAVSRIKHAGVRAVVASPRIIKPGEAGIWKTLLRLEPDALLIRSTGLLHVMNKFGGAGAVIDVGGSDSRHHSVTIPELIGDFSLNVANALTGFELLTNGCSRITASYDLGADAITELLESIGRINAEHVEIVTHAHLPIFHTEHCVFARFLSNGNSYVDCGHACTRHNVHLRDQNGDDNLVLADMGCRNTVFAAQAQSGAHSMKKWTAAGARQFRVELVDEGNEDVEKIVNGYLGVINGSKKPKELWETLEYVRDSNGRIAGVSYGSLRNGIERRAGEIL